LRSIDKLQYLYYISISTHRKKDRRMTDQNASADKGSPMDFVFLRDAESGDITVVCGWTPAQAQEALAGSEDEEPVGHAHFDLNEHVGQHDHVDIGDAHGVLAAFLKLDPGREVFEKLVTFLVRRALKHTK